MSLAPVFRRRKHDDRVLFVVSVLWLVGYSQRMIATSTGLRPKQVAGIIRAAGYENRAGMTDEERQAELHDLEAVRIDGGALDKVGFTIRPLEARQSSGVLRRKLRHG